MNSILENVPGLAVHQDDIIVFGANIKEHDERVMTILNVIETSGLKWNDGVLCLFCAHCLG